MKAIAVYPGMPHSMHLEEVPMPAVTDIPEGRGVLVKVLRVGVDGTDKEINEAKYGQAPEGERFLITGHESFGQVVAVGPNVPDTIKPGSYVVATVRRPGHSIYDTIGLQDMTTDDVYYERGINLRHGYLTEYYVEDAAYVVPLPETVRKVGVLLEPLTVAEKGLNQAFETAEALAKNGVLILSSVTGGDTRVEVNADHINQGFVLGNKVMVGTVNAARADFVRGVDDLIKAEALFPGWLSQLLTTPVRGLENYAEMLRQLTENRDAIKVYVEVA